MKPLTSRLLDLPHGFSTRQGGVSDGPFASLNAAEQVGDEPDRVRENLRRIAEGAGVAAERIATAQQVHGAQVVRVEASHAVSPATHQADALVTGQAGQGVGIRTADCVPLLLVDPRGRQVAAVHSGWKGTALEVSAAAVLALGSPPEQLRAAIGPSIRACCYEVSEELAARFAAQFGAEVTSRDDGPPHLDLARAVRLTLLRAGLREENIDTLPHCTSCEPADFYSHRRDKGVTGRHLSYVVCRF